MVLLPARLTVTEERDWVDAMVQRLCRSEQRRKPSDDLLMRRAEQLSAQYLHGLARPASVRWVDNQQHRWGSCTPVDRTIRLSHRLQGMPSWVIDYVLLHELAHLLDKRHSPAFWRMVDQLPRAERAKGFLEGATQAARAGAGLEAGLESGLHSGAEGPESLTATVEELAQ